ncbi:MAG: helix-turn-helix domain-containing protein [Chloroflexota bacterium]|nr:MAG: helix-turn-helix domain-containing protein [Chloroflexota bacterium]
MTKEDKTIRVEDYPSFGFWLQRRRKALDLTQAELARRAGCSAAMIRKIEADERKPSLQLAGLLAQQLRIPSGQHDAFVQFARGVEVGSQTGLETLVDGGQVDLTPAGGAAGTHETEPEPAAQLEPDDSGATIPNNLPLQTTPFFGRTAELASLAGFMSSSQKRLVTVLGPGGMGKTRLALATAEAWLRSPESVHRFADGIYFVPLAGVASADSLASAVAEALDFQFSGSDEPEVQLVRYLQGRRMLLVLDNFEHLLTGVRLVQAILDACPAVELLVTSREKLKLRSEQLLPIGGLTYPEQDETIEPKQATAYSALQLFVERARSARPSFELSDDNLNSVVAICRQVDGMPLGIVLAAAWIDTLTVAEITREIGRDIAFLETELSDVPARQRSLQAAFKYSWRLLSGQEQEIYRQLSVFRGGFTAEAAEMVTGATFSALQALVNKSLLVRSPARGQTAARYGIHEMLRQFAAEELAGRPALREATGDRHSVYYLTLLRRHEPRWHSDRQLETLATMARESDNITAAWRRGLATGAWEHLAGAIDSTGQYHLWQGFFAEGNALCAALETSLENLVGASTSAFSTAAVLWVKALAWHGVFLSTTEDALVKLEESLAFLDRQDPEAGKIRHLKAFVLRQMAWRLIPVAIRRSRRCAEQALQLSLGLGESWQVAESHYWLGSLSWRLGQLSKARENTATSLAMFRELGDRRMQVFANIVLAWIVQTEGDLAPAETLRYETLDLCRRISDRPMLIYCMGDLAYTLLLRGNLGDSLRSAEECVAHSVEYGFREKEGWARSVLGNTLMHLGHYDRARKEVDKALGLVKETGNRDVETGLWSALGFLALVPGDNGREAHAFFERGLQLNKEVQDEFFLGEKLGGLLLAACQMDASEKARQHAITHLDYSIRTRHHGQLIEALAAVAFYLAHYGDKRKALTIWQQVNGQPYIEASKWYADVVGREIEARSAGISPPPTDETAGHDLWLTAESLLRKLTWY